MDEVRGGTVKVLVVATDTVIFQWYKAGDLLGLMMLSKARFMTFVEVVQAEIEEALCLRDFERKELTRLQEEFFKVPF